LIIGFPITVATQIVAGIFRIIAFLIKVGVIGVAMQVPERLIPPKAKAPPVSRIIECAPLAPPWDAIPGRYLLWHHPIQELTNREEDISPGACTMHDVLQVSVNHEQASTALVLPPVVVVGGSHQLAMMVSIATIVECDVDLASESVGNSISGVLIGAVLEGLDLKRIRAYGLPRLTERL
jgi:hypothetical protein